MNFYKYSKKEKCFILGLGFVLDWKQIILVNGLVDIDQSDYNDI